MNTQCITAKQLGWVRCDTCDLVIENANANRQRCPRCGVRLASRLPKSISRTWALVVTAWIFIVPANVYPIMTVVYFGDGEPDTIFSGVVQLAQEGMLPIAIIVFIASIVVPVLKLISIMLLLIVVQRKWQLNLTVCTRLYRFIEFIGAWSMLDLFMISILAALVDLGAVATVSAGPAASAFALVVVITLFAAMSFDPRLIWDLQGEQRHD